MKNIYWLVGWIVGWICWFWAAASLPGLVFLATPPQIPIHFPLFTFFSLWLCFDFSLRWLGPFVVQFHGSSIPCLGDVPFKKKEIRNITHSYSNGIVYLYIITTATATARFCVKISWGLDSLIEDPHSVKKWFLDFTIPKKTCFLLSLK